MTVIRQSIVVDATPSEVWEVVADPRNLTRWSPHIRAVRGVPVNGLKQGDTYWTELRIVGIRLRVRALVVAIDPPRSSVIELFGPLEATVRTWVRPIGKRRARLEHEIDYTLKGGPLGEIVARAVRLLGAPTIVRHGIRAQKDQVELG